MKIAKIQQEAQTEDAPVSVLPSSETQGQSVGTKVFKYVPPFLPTRSATDCPWVSEDGDHPKCTFAICHVENNFCHPVMLAWFSILVISKFSKLSWSITGLKTPFNWALKCVKERLNDNLKILQFTRICMENHPNVTRWQKLFFSYKCF